MLSSTNPPSSLNLSPALPVDDATATNLFLPGPTESSTVGGNPLFSHKTKAPPPHTNWEIFKVYFKIFFNTIIYIVKLLIKFIVRIWRSVDNLPRYPKYATLVAVVGVMIYGFLLDFIVRAGSASGNGKNAGVTSASTSSQLSATPVPIVFVPVSTASVTGIIISKPTILPARNSTTAKNSSTLTAKTFSASENASTASAEVPLSTLNHSMLTATRLEPISETVKWLNETTNSEKETGSKTSETDVGKNATVVSYLRTNLSSSATICNQVPAGREL